MNGPEHYAKAEKLIAESLQASPEIAANLLAEAQVHATLAQVAATFDAQMGYRAVGMTQWNKLLGRS